MDSEDRDVEIDPVFLTLTEELNALDDLRHAVRFIQEAKTDLLAWKWAVISLHRSLYGFAVSACKGTDYTHVTRKGRGDWLITFDEALKRCQDKNLMSMTILSKPLILTKDQRESIDLLHNTFRNNFEHYIPRLWSIEVHGFPDIAIHCLEVIRFLALETGNYTHLEESQRQEVINLVARGIALAQDMDLYKDLHPS